MFLVELGRFIYWVPVWELLKIFAQNLHIYHRNDSTSACIIYFIYILVLEDVIGSDVGGGLFWPTLYFNDCITMLSGCVRLLANTTVYGVSHMTVDVL